MIPMNLTGAEIVVRALIEQGCQTVFGYRQDGKGRKEEGLSSWPTSQLV